MSGGSPQADTGHERNEADDDDQDARARRCMHPAPPGLSCHRPDLAHRHTVRCPSALADVRDDAARPAPPAADERHHLGAGPTAGARVLADCHCPERTSGEAGNLTRTRRGRLRRNEEGCGRRTRPAKRQAAHRTVCATMTINDDPIWSLSMYRPGACCGGIALTCDELPADHPPDSQNDSEPEQARHGQIEQHPPHQPPHLRIGLQQRRIEAKPDCLSRRISNRKAASHGTLLVPLDRHLTR